MPEQRRMGLARRVLGLGSDRRLLPDIDHHVSIVYRCEWRAFLRRAVATSVTRSRLVQASRRGLSALCASIALTPLFLGLWLALARSDGPAMRLRERFFDAFSASVVNVAVIAVPLAMFWNVRKPGVLGAIAATFFLALSVAHRAIPATDQFAVVLDFLSGANEFVAKPLLAVALGAAGADWLARQR